MFSGSLVALVTPMHPDGELDWESLERLVEFHVDNGSNAIIAVGTTGESPTLDDREHCAVIRRCVELARGRIPVIGGTGSNSTHEAVHLTRCAMEAGADACLLVTPYYNKPPQEGLYRHFRTIAEAVPIPQILYNVPGRTACDLKPETVARLAAISNIIGIKDATGDLERGRELLDRCGDKLDVFSGDDATAMELILMGGKGNISVTANVAPRALSELCAAALAGNRAEAERINAPLIDLHKDLFVEANPIPVKWALTQMDLIESGIRLPLVPLNEAHHERLRQAMRKASLL